MPLSGPQQPLPSFLLLPWEEFTPPFSAFAQLLSQSLSQHLGWEIAVLSMLMLVPICPSNTGKGGVYFILTSRTGSYSGTLPGHLTFLRLSLLIRNLPGGHGSASPIVILAAQSHRSFLNTIFPDHTFSCLVIYPVQTQLTSPGCLLNCQGVGKVLFLEATSGKEPQK